MGTLFRWRQRRTRLVPLVDLDILLDLDIDRTIPERRVDLAIARPRPHPPSSPPLPSDHPRSSVSLRRRPTCHSSSAASTAPRACKQIKHDVNLLVHTAIKINLPRRERRRVSFAALPVRGHQVETDRLIGEEPVRVKQNTTSVQLPMRMEIRVEDKNKHTSPASTPRTAS